MKKNLNFCNHCFTPSHRGKEVDMVDYIKKRINLPVNQGPHRLQCPCNKRWVKQVFLYKENQLNVRDSSFATLSEVDTLPPSLHLLQALLHLLQALLQAPALPAPNSHLALTLKQSFFNFRNYGSFLMQISPWKQHAANWGPKDEMNPLLTVKKWHWI